MTRAVCACLDIRVVVFFAPILDRVDVLLLEAPPDAAGEDPGEDDRGDVKERGRREDEVVQLGQGEHDPLRERGEDGSEVQQEEDDGQGDTQDAAAEDDVHGKVIAAPVTEHVHLRNEHLVKNSFGDARPFANVVYLIRCPVPFPWHVPSVRTPALRVSREKTQPERLVVRVPAPPVADGNQQGTDPVDHAPGQVQSKAVEGDDLMLIHIKWIS